MQVQKLLFFCHGRYLMARAEPLCRPGFEAWQHGPVQPLVYHALSSYGASPVVEPLTKFDPRSRNQMPLPPLTEGFAVETVYTTVSAYGRLSGSQLRRITHLEGTPWSEVDKSRGQVANVGLQISDELIRLRFPRHWRAFDLSQNEDEAHEEDAPHSRTGLSRDRTDPRPIRETKKARKPR